MPTSTTIWSGFVNASVTLLITPAAQTRMSASLAIDGTSTVRVWQVVTVAFACIKSIETGRPMTSDRPMTVARLPFGSIP